MKRGAVYPVGTTIGMYTTTGEVIRSNGRQFYPVVCECGTSSVVRNDRFKLNVVGCGKCKDFYVDHTGEVYNGQVIVGFSHKVGKVTFWRIKCACGKELSPKKLQSIKKNSGRCTCNAPTEVLNTKTTYGLLTFLNYSEDLTTGGKRKFVCKCVCGKRVVVSPWFFKNNKEGCRFHKNPVKFIKGKVILDVSTEELPDRELIVDIEDYAKIYKTQWYASKGLNTCYAMGSVNGRTQGVHKIILPTGADSVVDHQDQDGLNNCKSNLRETDKQGNARNTVIHRDNTSGVMGVCWKKDKLKWKAYITVSGRQIHLGYFEYEDFEDAVSARKDAESFYGFHENHGRVSGTV